MSSDAARPPFDLGPALEALEQQQARLADLQRQIAETTIRVESSDRAVAMEFDGQGEPRSIRFLNESYRTTAPAELADVLLRTLQDGRAQGARKMQELMPTDALGDIDIAGMMTGAADLSDTLGQIMRPALENSLAARGDRRTDEADDGWDRSRTD
ncbi:YbaB/EbfC family nucleoid-associated protein [Saccharopolyspora sp. NPDC000359]|uniref:YbaB/EbfC family nucleoid-associated protein n=1 Tax=Saccharopolyspora sp. NPDC000359 TaxID=3154251 RepID=UPI0033249C7B